MSGMAHLFACYGGTLHTIGNEGWVMHVLALHPVYIAVLLLLGCFQAEAWVRTF